MRKSSKVFAFLLAGAFLAALGWALVTQADLWQAHARPLRPRALPEGPEPPPGNAKATGVEGHVDDDTTKALEKNLKAERDARKRLDTPSGNRR